MSEGQRDPELDRLLSPLRDGPVALPGAEQEALQRERVVSALRSEVRRLPDRRRMRMLVQRSLSALAGVAAIGVVLFVAPRVKHTTSLHDAPRDGAMTELVWVDDTGEQANEDVPGTRPPAAREEPSPSAALRAGASAPTSATGSVAADEAALPRVVHAGATQDAPSAAVTPNAHEPREKASRSTRSKRSHRHALPAAPDGERRLLAEAQRAERSTQRKRARILFARFLRSYPRSALAPEARAGLARVR